VVIRRSQARITARRPPVVRVTAPARTMKSAALTSRLLIRISTVEVGQQWPELLGPIFPAIAPDGGCLPGTALARPSDPALALATRAATK
jgi:hypothetical protein